MNDEQQELLLKAQQSLEFHRYLIEAQELRTAGDYGQLNAITIDQATEQIDRAEQFLAIAIRDIGII